MVFSSAYFLSIFFPIFLTFFYLVRGEARKWVILIFSAVFYAWGAPIFFFYLIGSSLIDFEISKKLDVPNIKRKLYLYISLVLNIGLLIYFKYFNFFVTNVSDLSNSLGFGMIEAHEVLLPVGISFFTFQKISYSLDVYRGSVTPLQKLKDYLLYIMMFPQLIAGPIIRFKDIGDQILNYSENKFDKKLSGLYRFIIGLSKKVLISNTFALVVNQVNEIGVTDLSTFDAWLGILAYTFHIYYDFAGYSDMAIGIGLMIGFKFPENFNFPYLSRSITEFWQRWHITLGAWLKDYLYIPLGGNRKGSPRTYFNLVFVFFISGFWHGAEWNFVIWGLFHGSFLMIERAGLINLLKRFPPPIQIGYTFFVVIIGWVFFSFDLETAGAYLQKMFAFAGAESMIDLSAKTITFMLIGVLFAFAGYQFKVQQKLNNVYEIFTCNSKRAIISYPIFLTLLILSFLSIMTSGFNPFIYYRF